jgi:hypothetical protein
MTGCTLTVVPQASEESLISLETDGIRHLPQDPREDKKMRNRIKQRWY